MATINNSMTAVAAAWEIDQRIIYHTATGEMLDGLNYDYEGTLKVDGEDDMPLMQPWSVLTNEGLSPGIPSPGNKDAGRKNQPVSETLTLNYRIVGSRKDLWFRRDPQDVNASKGFLEWIALIRDAIETPAFPTNVTVTGCSNATFNADYVFNISNSRWEKVGDATYFIEHNSGTDTMELNGLGDVQFIKAGPVVVGHYDEDGSVSDPDGIDVIKGVTQTIQPDAALLNSAYKPVKFTIQETDTTQLAFHALLEVEIYLHHYCRAGRSGVLPLL